MKRVLAALVAAAPVVGCSLVGCHEIQPPIRPELVLLLSIDTLRADHVGCYGYSPPTTPTLDALCRRGVVFLGARAHAPSTLLSHGSILTSQIPQHHGGSHVQSRPLAASAPTLAEAFHSADWATLAITGGGQMAAEYGFARGFEAYETVTGRFDETVDRFLDRHRAILDDDPAAKTFAFLHTYEVHHPYEPTLDDLVLFDRGYSGPLPSDTSVDLLRKINRGEIELTPRDLEYIVATYDAEIRSVDRALGRLLRAIGDEVDILLAVTSDHGEAFGERGRVGWHSLTLHEEMLAVPLILFGKGVVSDRRVEQTVRSIDIGPTLLESSGVAIPTSFQGRSLVPFLRGEDMAVPDLVVAYGEVENRPPFHAIAQDGWKLYEDALFHLPCDPDELHDKASSEVDRTRALRRHLRELLVDSPHGSRTVDLQDETLEQLEALGYL
ncbi:MAG: sulfatase [Acidobacteriota bacterium]